MWGWYVGLGPTLSSSYWTYQWYFSTPSSYVYSAYATLFIHNKISLVFSLQVAGIKYWDEIYGSQASINVYEPKVKQDSNDLSASWIQIGSVPKVGKGVGIGAGSCVYPSFSGDSFARFHISWVRHKQFFFTMCIIFFQ